MKPTIEILTKLQENSVKNHDEVFTKLFRYTLRPDIYYVAYQNLYANNGAATKGVNEDTADGFNEDYVTLNHRIFEERHLYTEPGQANLHQESQRKDASIRITHLFG